MKTSLFCPSDAIASPPLDGSPKQYSPKIQQLVNDIACLTLLEVSDLNELLKVKAYCEVDKSSCSLLVECLGTIHNMN